MDDAIRLEGGRRIAWILYGSLDQRTGGTIYDAQIVAGLRRRGDVVDVLSIERPRTTAERSPTMLVRELNRLRPDLIVGDELCFRELAFVFSRVRFAPRLLLVHHLTCWEEEQTLLERARARRWETLALRHADSVLATSHATRRRLVDEGYRGRVDVVLSGADRLPRGTRGAQAVDPRFLFVGAVIPRKRVRELVLAFASLPPPMTLRLAGRRDADPAYTASVVRIIDELGCRDRVTFLGEIDEATLSRELAEAHALVMPSSLEGYGIAATEAVRAGTPVIATRTPGLEEALAPCPGGVLFFAEGALAHVMNEVATNRALQEGLAEAAGRARFPTWADAADRFGAVLDDLVTLATRDARPPPG